MGEFLAKAGGSLPFILLLLALLGMRARVTPRGSVQINALPEKVFALMDPRDGDRQPRQTGHVAVDLIDAATQTFRMTYVTRHQTGVETSSQADFRVAERDPPLRLVLERAGLEGKSENNQLLRITAAFTPEGQGTRYRLEHAWGSRPLIAQLIARADLYSGLYRFKTFAETGQSSGWAETIINAAVSIVTGVVTLAAFAIPFGLESAVILVAALFVHEFGHLLAFRMIGQPWGRMIFLPFLGALAVPRMGYETQAQSVFSALMGPAFSLIIPALAVAAVYNDALTAPHLITIGLVAAALNLFNLLPVEPLDGGVALRSVFAHLFGGKARFGLMIVGAAILAGGIILTQPVLLIFGGISILANLRPREIDTGLAPLSGLEAAISVFSFVAIVAAYFTAFVFLRQFIA
jgi:Zn-dependent protease